MEKIKKAMKLADLAGREQAIQMPDYEWRKINHQRKMQMRLIKRQAELWNSLFGNLWA